MRKYFGDKKFYLTTITIVLPIMAQQFVTSFVNLIDNVMIGNLGSLALTSVTVANKIYMMFTSLLFGICGAACIFVAQYYGSQDHKKCQKILDLNLLMALLCGVLFVSALIALPDLLLGFFTTRNDVLLLAKGYVKIAVHTYIPYAISYTIMSALRSVGINKIQMYIGILTVLINTSLNYILIFGHLGFNAMGVEGAAIATLIARIIEMCIYIYLLLSKKYYFHLKIKEMFKIDFTFLSHITSKAIPLTFNEVMFSLGMSLIFISYVRCDESLIAAVSVVDTVKQLMFIVFGGLSTAISILIGNKLGANQIEEAKANAYKLIGFGMMVAFATGIIFIVLSPLIASLYNVEDVIRDMIIKLIIIKSCVIPAYVYNISIFFIIRAGGDTFTTMLVDSVSMWAGSVFISTVLSFFFEIPLIVLYIIVEFCDVVKMGLCRYFFKQGNWARNLTDV